MKTSYRHLKENSTKYDNHLDFLANFDFNAVILFFVQFQGSLPQEKLKLSKLAKIQLIVYERLSDIYKQLIVTLQVSIILIFPVVTVIKITPEIEQRTK